MSGLDELAGILFPDNRAHRRIFVAVWLKLKYAEDQFVHCLDHLCREHGFSERQLEIVRAKMRKMGLLKRVSHFSPHHGHVAGWTFSSRFAQALRKLADAVHQMRSPETGENAEQKDRDSILYL